MSDQKLYSLTGIGRKAPSSDMHFLQSRGLTRARTLDQAADIEMSQGRLSIAERLSIQATEIPDGVQ